MVAEDLFKGASVGKEKSVSSSSAGGRLRQETRHTGWTFVRLGSWQCLCKELSEMDDLRRNVEGS